MAYPLGRRRNVPLRSLPPARRGLRDRHTAADGQRLAARRARVLVHAHRRHRPLPAHARQGGLLPDGVGRQRPPDGAARPELLRREVRPVAAVRRELRATGHAREAGRAGLASQLHRAVRAPDLGRRGRLRGDLAPAGPLRGLVAHLRHDRPPRAARVAGLVPAAARQRAGLSARSADAVGRRLPHGGGAGRARGSRAARRVSPAALPVGRDARRRCGDRNHAARTASGVRGARRPSGRCALSAALRHRRADAPLRRPRARAGPRARRPGEGQRHRDDLHLRRHQRRHVVARALAAGAGRDSDERHAEACHVRCAGLGVGGRRRGPGRLRADRRAVRGEGPCADRRTAAGIGRAARRPAADHARGQVLREG